MIYLAEPHAAGLTTTGYVLHAARMGLSGIWTHHGSKEGHKTLSPRMFCSIPS
jgi:hypothetical protein